MDPKKQLADLMDAFAAAKASQNEMLQRLVLGQINAFFQTHEITPIQQSQVPAPQPQAPALEEDDMSSWS